MNEFKEMYNTLNDLHYEIMGHTNQLHDMFDHSDRRLSRIWMMLSTQNDIFKFILDEFDKEITPF